MESKHDVSGGDSAAMDRMESKHDVSGGGSAAMDRMESKHDVSGGGSAAMDRMESKHDVSGGGSAAMDRMESKHDVSGGGSAAMDRMESKHDVSGGDSAAMDRMESKHDVSGGGSAAMDTNTQMGSDHGTTQAMLHDHVDDQLKAEAELNDDLQPDQDNEGSKQPASVLLDAQGQPLSKKQTRRLQKMHRLNQTKQERRRLERDNRKRRRQEAQAAGLPVPVGGGNMRKALKQQTMATSSCSQRLVVDMAYDHLMSDRDRKQCVHQLCFCYASNRRMGPPAQLYYANFNGPTRQQYDSVPARAQWDVHVREEAIDVLFPASQLVYLSSESHNLLTQFDPQKVYVIGGLVDRNQHKGVCHARAVSQGWAHARLPLQEYVHLDSRRVLTINHVFDIVRKHLLTNDWAQAFDAVLPKRKGVHFLGHNEKEVQGPNVIKGQEEGEGNGEVGDTD